MGWFNKNKKTEYVWNEDGVIKSSDSVPSSVGVQKREPTALELLMDMRERIAKLEASQSGQAQSVSMASSSVKAEKDLSDEEKEELVVQAVKDVIEYLNDSVATADQKFDADMRRIVAGRVYQHFKKK